MGSHRFRGSEGGSRFRWVPTGSWLRFVRFWSSGSWWVFDGVWRFRRFRVSMGSRRFQDQELQKTCGTKFLPSWGWHLCKKGLLNLLAVGDTTYVYFALEQCSQEPTGIVGWDLFLRLKTYPNSMRDQVTSQKLGSAPLTWMMIPTSFKWLWSMASSFLEMTYSTYNRRFPIVFSEVSYLISK